MLRNPLKFHKVLPNERYQAFAAVAAQKGLTTEMLAEIWLSERQEAELIRQIKLPIVQTIYLRYKDLIARRDQQQLEDVMAELGIGHRVHG